MRHLFSTLLALFAAFALYGQPCSNLFISEYVEGSSNNKYIELYNPTDAAIDLSDYQLRRYANGTSIPTAATLSGSIPAGGTVVYANSSATLYEGAATNLFIITHNGDDAYDLYKISTGATLDIFGQIGCDPGSQWGTTTINETQNQTLRRNSSVTRGITTNPGDACGTGSFTTLQTEWTELAIDNVSDLGSHTFDGCPTNGGCSITLINVTEPECQAAPFDDQSSFTVTFNVTGGSGQYFLSNPNTNILNGSSGPPGGQPTDGIISFNGQADITGNTEGTMAPVRLYNSANPSECFVDFMINVPVCPEPSCPTEAFINEFHYDNAGGDVGEFIEVAVSDDFMGNLSDLKVELYNGNGGSSYNILELSSATEGSTEGGYTYYTLNLPSNGLQNGSPDGMALACGTTLIEFLSYEGTMTASNGVANGMTSTDVGVAESSSQVIGGSIQLIDNVWTLTCDDTPGAANALGLPCGWSDSEGVGCTAGATTYDPSTETFTLSSGDCQIGGYPYTADQISFVHEELCGDGTIKAYIEAVNGNGIAGIQMRETLDPGAKKVEIGTNRTNRIVRAYRFTNNYPAFPQELYSLDKFWLKIERTGNTFKAFASVDDIVYYPYLFQTISMGSCIEAGIFVYSKDGSAVTADFTDVEVINGPIPFAAEIKDVTQSEANTTALGSGTTNAFATANTATANIGLTPNPARDVVTLNLDQVIGEETIIRIFNINGQLMNQLQFDRVEDANHDINIDELPAGTYYVNVRTTSTQQTLKLIKQ